MIRYGVTARHVTSRSVPPNRRCEIEKEALRERCTLEADERWREESRSALEAQEVKLRAEATAAARREAKVKDKQVGHSITRGNK